MNEQIELTIVTPTGKAASALCDSVHLTAQDDQTSRNGGGVGIRKGHVPAMIALKSGEVVALLEGEVVLTVKIQPGFASVSRNQVTVLTSGIE